MKDEQKTKEQRINELVELRQRVAELEAVDTERKRAEEALREREKRYALATKAGQVGAWDWNLETNEIYLDPQLKAMLGYADYEIRNHLDDWGRHVHPDDVEQVMAEANAHLEGLTPQYEVVHRMLHKDGSIRWFLARGTAMRDANGKPYRVVGTDTDITERKRAEEEIRQHTTQLEALRQMGLELAAELDLDTLLRSIISRAVELLGGTTGGLDLYRPDRDVLELAVSIGLDSVPSSTVIRRGEGLSGKIWETGEPLILDDYQHWEGRAAVYEGYPFGGMVGVPVRWGEEFLGALLVEADPSHVVSPADAELLSLFAAQAAIAIRNARLYESERKRIAELEALRQASLHLTSTLELQPILEAILDHALKLVAAYDAHIFLYDGERLAFGTALWEDGRQQKPYSEPRPQGLTYTVARSGERIVIPDVDSHPLFRDYPWGGAIVGLPLCVGERVVGVMTVALQRPHAFDEGELRVLGLLADQAAIAIENAHLYEAVQQELTERKQAEEALERRAVQMATLNRIGHHVASILDQQELFQRAADAVREDLGYPRAAVLFVDEEASELYVAAATDDFWDVIPDDYRQPVGKGAIGVAAETEETVLVKDAPDDSRVYEVGKWFSPSSLSTPIKIGGQVIGVLEVEADMPNAFDENDVMVMDTLADQVAVAIENARLYEAIQQKLAELQRAEEELLQRQLRLSVLNRMGRALAGTFELARIYRIAYEHVAQLVDCPSFGISLYDPPTRTLRAEFMLDDGELIDAARFPPLVMDMEPTQGRVRAIATRQPEIITDYPAVLEKATKGVRVGVSRDEHVTGAAMYVPMVARGQVIGLLEVQSYRLNAYSVEHAALLGPVANQIGLSIQNAQLYEEAQRELVERKRAEGELRHTLEKLREALGGIIQTVALAVETKDPYTAGHQRRVANLARAIANEMGLPREQIDGIRMAGLIHDLGKIAIPAEILSTPIRLNDFQWGMIKTHPQVGYDILKTIDFPWPVAQIVLQHHERLDGSGYPQGLSGEEIMLEARILAVADVVEAMASFRPYRPTLGIDKALEEISQNRGILYDAEVVDACLKLFTEKGFKFE